MTGNTGWMIENAISIKDNGWVFHDSADKDEAKRGF